ncbi:GNAT family N-acetyltransferase, partial [Streptomyces sp. MBT57]|nr:GNAT family N-acetyltransferase [Streptomyces sp. MBT57]
MPHVNWTVTPERFDSPDATALRRDYYDEVASRYWQRPATAAELAEG